MTTTDDSAPPARTQRRERLESESFDVLVVGGGVTGAGLALDLAARGLTVACVEQGDWGGATSSASSRLVHGGLRYLEHGELGLVREACLERALLLRNAAGLVWPETFAFPVRRGDRVPRWKLAAGLLLYTALSVPRALGFPKLLSADAVAQRIPGVDASGLTGAGAYLDGATDDARLCWAVVRTAIERGAVCLSRAEVTGVEDGAAGVDAQVLDREGGATFGVRARAAVLCGGPFAEALRARAGLSGRWIAPTRGSHVIVPRERLFTDGAVIFSTRLDGRVMFLIPWPRHTVIGTTDLDASAEEPPAATRAEVRYLLDSANGLVPAAALTEDDVVSTWSGLRPLLAAPEDDPSARSREERVAREGNLYTIAGGKLTGYRSMAEKLGGRIAHDLGLGVRTGRSPTRTIRLWGALDGPVDRPAWSSAIPEGDAVREQAWQRRYGTRIEAVRAACRDDGVALDPETLAGEATRAATHEDALGADDVLWRRTDVGYGRRADVEAVLPAVVERLAAAHGWSAERSAAEAAAARARLERLHGWRG